MNYAFNFPPKVSLLLLYRVFYGIGDHYHTIQYFKTAGLISEKIISDNNTAGNNRCYNLAEVFWRRSLMEAQLHFCTTSDITTNKFLKSQKLKDVLVFQKTQKGHNVPDLRTPEASLQTHCHLTINRESV